MLSQLTAEEFEEWLAFAKLEPFGAGREDLRAALIVAVANNRWRGKNEHPAKVEEIFPDTLGARARRQRRSKAHAEKLEADLVAAFGRSKNGEHRNPGAQGGG